MVISSRCGIDSSNQICNNSDSNLGIVGVNLEKSFNKGLDNAVSSNEAKEMS